MDVERSIQNIELTQAALLTIIKRAFPQYTKIDHVSLLSGGALNTTYKIQIGSSSFVLRLYARDRAHCAIEKAIYQLISDRVPVPLLIYADENYEPQAFSLFEFVSGKHITLTPPNEKKSLSYELGRTLALIHSFKFDRAGFFGKDLSIDQSFEQGSSPYYEEALSILSHGLYARHRLGEDLADRTLSFMKAHKDFFPIIGDNICLTHADFKPVNLLYNEGKVWVLDWEFAHAGVGIIDFAILLRHRSHFPFDKSSLAQGYTDFGGVLPVEWFKSALITDFVNIITLIETPPERPKLFQNLRRVVHETITNLE